MDKRSPLNLKRIAGAFGLLGSFESAAPYGSGHINDTFAVVYDQGGRPIRYILQRVNENVFKDGEALMENIRRVTAHQHRKLEAAGAREASRKALTLVPATDGRCFHRDPDGNLWRAYVFVEHATGHDRIETTAQAEAAAKAFGEFQKLLVDLPGGPLHETIPQFHDTASRFQALLRAIEADACNRAAGVKAEIDFALARQADADRLLALQRSGAIPTIATHNDTKLNNVLLDDATGEGICVIDLDTVMPGLALYDFGDMVRTATISAPEDEPDVSKVHMRMPMFEALVRGYLASAGDFLNATEQSLLPFAGKLLTFECAIRFLADYLQGDVYFKTHRPGQNLDRCRSQFKLVESIEEQHDAMLEVVTCKGMPT